MKKVAILSLLLSSLAFAAQAAGGKYNALEGNWSGKITKNFKMSSAGGKPTASETGAPAKISLSASGEALKGTSTTGTDSEKWEFTGDTYTWTDAEMSVSAKATTKLPAWVQAELSTAAGEQLFAFKFDSCTISKTSKPCEVKTHIPEGITDGYWIFRVKDKNLTTAVLYKYPTGGVRHLSEELTK